MYCNDTDLLHWEPNIFRDAAFASQLLLAGTGDLAGTAFTLDAGVTSLSAAHVAAGNVIVINGAINGSYPIISVNSATELTLSVMYDGLFPEDGSAAIASPAGTANDQPFVIRTFAAQRKVVTDLLNRAAGVGPEVPGREDAVLLNPQSLRRACVLGTLQLIYSALAAVADEPANLALRAELYERLYRRALRHARVELDLDGDGREDTVRELGVLVMRRR